MTTEITTPDARAARRQTLLDRWTEYLADRVHHPEHAAAYARDLRDVMDELGFRLPASLEDVPPRAVTPAADDSPGRRAWAEARAALAARRHAAPSP